ncbi:hypothetical protein DMC47_29535 [Nostoc sp. 3335mG]|nr:hypothetical protein DMC47_29535 [Nostoc sp. 3335mG]
MRKEMTMRALIGGLIGMVLTAPALAGAPQWANPFNQKVMALSLADRNGALRRAITNDDNKCGRLSKSAYRGPYGNLGLWVAHCQPGGDYAIFTGPDETVQVRACADMKSLKLPECGKLD